MVITLRCSETASTMQDNSNRCNRDVHRFCGPEREPARQGMTVLDSAQLFADHREVCIRHRGEFYRLLMTKNGKLILNK